MSSTSATPALPTFPLSHGGPIPVIGYGLGTAIKKQLRARAAARESTTNPIPTDFKGTATESLDQQTINYVTQALETGFTHLDGAETYGNEAELGAAVKSFLSSPAGEGKERSELFIVTKVLQSISSPTAALATSLKNLDTEYVNLYLIHAPFWDESAKGITIEEAWKQLESLLESGKTKAIGVSNFRIQDLERIRKIAKVLPAVNQIEFHPYLQSEDLVAYHKEHGIRTVAYGPLVPITKAKGGPLDEVLERLGKKYGKSETQILLRWTVEKEVVAVTTSFKEWRLKEALAVGGFELEAGDVEEITRVGKLKHSRNFWNGKFTD